MTGVTTEFTLHVVVGQIGVAITHIATANTQAEQILIEEIMSTDAESFVAEVTYQAGDTDQAEIGVFEITGTAHIDIYERQKTIHTTFDYTEVVVKPILEFESTEALTT